MKAKKKSGARNTRSAKAEVVGASGLRRKLRQGQRAERYLLRLYVTGTTPATH